MKPLIPLNDLFLEPGPRTTGSRTGPGRSQLNNDHLLTISTLPLGSPVMGL